MIKFTCGDCNHTIGAPEQYAGKVVPCPNCSARVQVPTDTDEVVMAQEVIPTAEVDLELTPAEQPTQRTHSSAYSGQRRAHQPAGHRRSTSPPVIRKRTKVFIIVACILAVLAGAYRLWDRHVERKRLAGFTGPGMLFEGPLFSITDKNYKHGFIDNTGKVIIKPAFDDVGLADREFSEGLALVRVGRKYCYINKGGKIAFILDSRDLEMASDFSEGLASVAYNVGGKLKYGYVDKTGQPIIEPQFSDASKFSNGLAAVNVGGTAAGFLTLGGSYGYIDNTGEFVIEPVFDHAGDFSEGLACVLVGGEEKDFLADVTKVRIPGLPKVKSGGKYGYIDADGYYAIEPQFDYATSFSEGLALVSIRRKLCFINSAGQIVIDGGFDSAEPFSDGLACVREGDLSGYIDQAGYFVIEPQFAKAAHSFSEGLAAVVGDNGKYGFIDKTGNFVIEPKYDFSLKFVDGLARVHMGEYWGYIDKTGQLVWQTKY